MTVLAHCSACSALFEAETGWGVNFRDEPLYQHECGGLGTEVQVPVDRDAADRFAALIIERTR